MEKMIYSDYEKVAKVGQRIVLGGTGILDGIEHADKASSYKIVAVADNKVWFVPYRSKRRYTIAPGYKHQEVAILTNKEFAALPLYR